MNTALSNPVILNRYSCVPKLRQCGDVQMNDLMENMDKLHTTDMGAERIKRNCQMEIKDVVQWSKTQILDKTAKMERIGKNWYVTTVDGFQITVNAHSCTIITAHKHPRHNEIHG